MPSAGAFFFDGRPCLLDPLADAFLVSFHGLAYGPLRAPVHGVQQASDVIHVIAHAESALDVLGHPGTSPKIGGESGGLRAFEQVPFQPLAVALGEFGRPATGRNSFERRPAAKSRSVLPAPHAARIYVQAAGDFGLGQAMVEQIDGALAFALKFLRTALWTDRSPRHNKNGIGHYLCTIQ
jgi:hypothetical protein